MSEEFVNVINEPDLQEQSAGSSAKVPQSEKSGQQVKDPVIVEPAAKFVSENTLRYHDLFRIFGKNLKRDVVHIGNTRVTIKWMFLSLLIFWIAISMKFSPDSKKGVRVRVEKVEEPVEKVEEPVESCSSGTYRCNGGGSWQVCSADGVWGENHFCHPGAVCSYSPCGVYNI
jgi:hypothetical protein